MTYLIQGPTLTLKLIGRNTPGAIAEIGTLPVPISVNPDGYITVDELKPTLEASCAAFYDTWMKLCGQAVEYEPRQRDASSKDI
ncbi:hypothetical protein KIH79_09230 [Bifidobacterium sp. 82T10]|uniref:Tensin-4 n=1 Tax=Bifidobacterium miconis TaxID=2834435 RepID=A0ABS6WGA0_9BIFI|nr:hypothetical protein [Bifidobacterium miconis]MBW3093098.1 hypothetical protein [Bifidobacterium miconis]